MKARVLHSQTATLLRLHDWSRSTLGPVAQWPRSLRSHVEMVMDLPSPAIIFWGPDQTQIYNDGYALIMGPRHPRYFGAPYRECWPDTYPLIYPWMRRVLDHGEVIEVVREPIPVTRYGFEEDAFFTFTFSPLRDDDGRIAGILQPVFEVTDAVLSERRSAVLAELTADRRRVRRPAEVLRVLARATEDVPAAALFLRDAAGGGCRCEDTSGAERWGPQLPPALGAAAEQVCASGEPVRLEQPPAFVLPLPASDGGRCVGAVVLGLNPRLHVDERYREFLHSVARQIAALLQRITMQRTVERQQAYLRELFLQVPAGIALLEGPEHVFALANPLYQSIVGGRAVMGRPIRDALPELEHQRFLALLDEVYRRGTAHVGASEAALLADARGELNPRYFNYVFQPTHDEAGQTTGILVFCYEVSDQVRAQHHSDALTRQLQQEHQRKDEFLAMLAHELRNPLAPISSAAELLRGGHLDAESTAAAAAVIVRQVRHMTALVDDLLDVSRVTRGLVEIERRPQWMGTVVLDAVEQVRSLVHARGHELTLELPEPSPQVQGDRKRLVQIVANLLTNAAKYTPDGGEIRLAMSADDGLVELSVADNGIGIPAELLSHVFEPFVQARRSKDRSDGGLGIGLALVKSLTELHGGTVACESAGSGRGSRFIVRLPCAEAADTPPVPDDDADGGGLGHRILVVDDNVDAAQMLALLLRGSGHEVLVETQPLEVVSRAEAYRPDVALLDIGLPDLDGCELATRLRARAATAHTVLVAISGYGQAADRERARRAGFDHYLVKPVDFGVLESLLGRASGLEPRPSAAGCGE